MSSSDFLNTWIPVVISKSQVSCVLYLRTPQTQRLRYPVTRRREGFPESRMIPVYIATAGFLRLTRSAAWRETLAELAQTSVVPGGFIRAVPEMGRYRSPAVCHQGPRALAPGECTSAALSPRGQ